MKLSELFETKQTTGVNRVIAVLCGRFQPPTPAHIAAYKQLATKFGPQNTYISMTSALNPEKSPLTYDERKQIFVKLLGVPADKVINVKNQYNVEQIAKLLQLSDDTAIVFAVGQKDMEENPRFSVKSSESYIQKYKAGEETSYLDHMFIDVIDTKKFFVRLIGLMKE